MAMNSIVFFVTALCILLCSIMWILPLLITWFIKTKYSLDIRVGRVGLPYLNLQDVDIIKNGYSIHIDKIGFRSSFFSSEVTKLLCLVVCEIRINKDVTYSNNGEQPVEGSRGVTGNGEDLLLHNQKIPPIIIKCAQFLAIHVRNVTAIFLRPESPEWLLHATAMDVHLDGSLVQSASILLVNITMTSASARLLRHAPAFTPSNMKMCGTSQSASCLCEMSIALNAEATLAAQGPISVEKLSICVEAMKTVIDSGFYGFVQQRYHSPAGRSADAETSEYRTSAEEVYVALHRFAPIIPKVSEIKLNSSTLTGMKDSIRTEIDASLSGFLVKTCFVSEELLSTKFDHNIQWPHISIGVRLNTFEVISDRDKIISLKEFGAESKLEKNNVIVSAVVNTLAVVYNHKDIHSWLLTNFGYLSSSYKSRTSVSKITATNRNIGRHWLNGLNVDASLDLLNVVTCLRLQPDFVCGLSHVKFSFSCDSIPAAEGHELKKTSDVSKWEARECRNWTCEFLLDNGWANLCQSYNTVSPVQLKKNHYWGFPLFVGIVLVKIKSNTTNNSLRIQAMVDVFRFEWSPPFANFLHTAYKCLTDYYIIKKYSEESHTGPELKAKSFGVVTCNAVVSNTNLFFIAERKVCVVMRIDSINSSYDDHKLCLTFEGVKLASIIPTQQFYTCCRSTELKGSNLKMKAAKLEWKEDLLVAELVDAVDIRWSTNVHLKLLTLFDDVKETLKNISGTHNSPDDEIEPAEPKESESGLFSVRNIQVSLKGHCSVGIKVSSKGSLTFSTDCLSYVRYDEYVKLESPLFKISVDSDNIFTVENFSLTKIFDDEVIKSERSTCEGFVLPWNRVWEVTIHTLKAVFPYDHNFNTTFQEEFLSVIKWLRLIHNKPKYQTQSTILPADLVIKVKEFLFEMSDDPFEVSLRDSYELLVDEYGESIKRQKMLDERLAVLYKDRLIPAEKIEELHASLQKINAQIYIQRSKQMKSQSPVRTRLFAWIISDLQIISLADPSIFGAENVVHVMTEIDCDSPWPEEGIEFTTLWCRFVVASCKEWKFQLRDFPQPWLDIGEMQLWGRLVGAEQEATKRAKRTVTVELGDPYTDVTIERSMTSLKFYHDFNCEVERFIYAFGPCWEPVISQCNITFGKIVSASKDPSPPLPFWDKMRLRYHGRLTMMIRQLTLLLHASLDPYNRTEEMEITWNDVAMDWTNAKFIFKGDLEVYVRTASKYDDCRMLYLPNLKLVTKLTWNCLGIPNDHHSVMLCAPDKLPEYSSNQEHDSFRQFRSQNLNLSLMLETKPLSNPTRASDCPVALLYGSTLRWFENLKLILSGVTRPTRRGAVFNNLKPRRLPLSRHYRKVHLSLVLHKFQVHYWMSFSMQRGLELSGQRFSFASEYMLTLVPIDDGLRHRPTAVWSTMYMNCDLNDAEIWLKSALQLSEETKMPMNQPVEKCYFLSVGKVQYGRVAPVVTSLMVCRSANKDDTPTHRLVVYRLKGAWTPNNRDIIFALYDSFRKTQQLKKNLSTAALKGFRCSDSGTPIKSKRSTETSANTSVASAVQNSEVVMQETPSPLTKLQSGHAASMLQQLIAEAENKAVVFSDDLSVQMREQHLQGLASCQEDDVLHKNWLIALVNSQVLLKGCETKGYVIMSAAKAEILQKIHRPVWKDRTLVSKTSWVGSLECMQYYATVSANDNDALNENIMWLSVENIQEKEASCTIIADLPDLPHLVGSGQSVGGVISETVGAACNLNENTPLQLQRIVSRCKCEFFYASFGESSIDPSTLDEVPSPPTEDYSTPWERQEKAIDAFTLMHHDLDVCTNFLQYAMILDIANNLLLYVEPRRKEAYERLQTMRFQLQLHSVQDQRKPIQQLQNLVRCLLAKLRRLEKEMYLVQKNMAEGGNTEELLSEMEHLDAQMDECKEQLNAKSEELDMMLSCYIETQLSANQKVETLKGDKPVTPVRTSEICFKHAQWRLTEADGQLGIADLVLSNFLYTKVSKSDDSVEHLLELGYIRMTNLLANEPYKEVIVPTEIQSNMPVARKRALRIFCREKAPVGGISVKEHFEINVVPFTIGLTKKFYDTMMNFCFPERHRENADGDDSEDSQLSGGSTVSAAGGKKVKSQSSEKSSKKRKEASFYVPIEMQDDVEKMKQRAEKNKLFIYIKIPEVPVRVSYKGTKEKNLKDIRDFSLIIPTLEYHNVTWTWLDLFLAMKSDSKRVLLSQAIKQKLQIKVRSGSSEEGSSPQEEDKARMLFGSRLMLSESKVPKKPGIFKLQK